MTDPIQLQRLLPPGPPADVAAILADLDLRPRHDRRPRLVLNMVSSVDGRATLDGRSGGLGNAGDRQLFHGLRARVDAVMAGAGTVRAERYGPMIRDDATVLRRTSRGLEAQPLAVVVSRSLRLDPNLPLLADAQSRVVVLTQGDGTLPPCAAQLDYVRNTDLAGQLQELRSRHGVESVVCEGGPTLNAGLLSAGLVDDVFLSVSPVLVGGIDPLTILTGSIPQTRLELVALLASEHHLHAQYAVQR